ncbi:MAG: Lactate utilization protein A [Acidimicrobiales bacterium AG-410-I20]|nr:MAG: Lactate utilization protein A [Acidimicrobiales bacterium AG-410-I20]
MSTPLGLEENELIACVSCGLCLPHCPTYQVTQDESRSPRGRISLMRGVESGSLAITKEVIDSMDTCVQCMGCETACPSSVQYGSLIERTREVLINERKLNIRLRIGLWMLLRMKLLMIGSRLLALIQRSYLLPNKLLPISSRIPLSGERYRQDEDPEVIFFTGCIMDAWLPKIHKAGLSVLEALGVKYVVSGSAVGCCGALHNHAGLRSTAKEQATKVMTKLPPDLPILVDSAGCGAALKEYKELLKTEEAKEFSSRVYDIHEWLVKDQRWEELSSNEKKTSEKVIVQDPCHLRHVQGVHNSVRELLDPFVECIELDDEGLCCGAGGAFSLNQPEMSSEIRDLKLQSINRAGGHTVVSANPGCMIHLETSGVEVMHPIQVVEKLIYRSKTDD